VPLTRDVLPGTVIEHRAAVAYAGLADQLSNSVRLTVRKPQRYGLATTRSCFPAAPNLPAIVRRLDTLRRLAYDSVTLNLDYLLPAYAINLDTVIRKGDTLWGVEILSDTEFERALHTTAGCDSILTVRVMADLTSTTNQRPGTLRLFPNPATDYCILQLPAGLRLTFLEISDLLGRTYAISTSPQRGDGWLIDLGRLPKGTFVVRGRDDKGRIWRGKLVAR
ncbi:MAG: hypothetical protein AAFZ52_18600, partial [Bacteroidota bacterium]